MSYGALARSNRGAAGGGHPFATLGEAVASRVLRDAGVPGIRYLDGFSRGAGEGSSNYVMFSDEPVEIVRRYRRGGRVVGLGA